MGQGHVRADCDSLKGAGDNRHKRSPAVPKQEKRSTEHGGALSYNCTGDAFAIKSFFSRKLPAQTAAWKLYPKNLVALNRFVEELKLRAYSGNTLRTYRGEFLQLLNVLKTKPVSDITPDDLRRYMVYAMEKEGISEGTANSRLNAIKFYFEQC